MPKKSPNSSAAFSSRLLEAGYPDFLALKELQPLSPPTPPTLQPFPNFFELAEEEAQRLSTKLPERRPGERRLFEALLGDPKVLYLEYLEDPSRFDEETGELVQQLSHGALHLKDLNQEQMQLLDLATLEYAAPRRSRKPFDETKSTSEQSRMVMEHLTRREALDDPDIELEYREDGNHTPIMSSVEMPNLEGPPTRWWEK